MTPDQLEALGELIYGEGWKAPMSEDLGVARKTVIRWAQGEFKIPDGVHGELLAIAKKKAREAIDRASRLEKAVRA